MSDSSLPSANLPEPTDVHFSIRALLIAMVAVAVLASALGPYFRSLAPADRTQVAIPWGISAALAGLWIGYHMRSRLRLEDVAGRKLLELSPRGERIRNIQPWMRYVGGMLLVAVGPLYLLLATPSLLRSGNIRPPIFSYVFPSAISAMAIANGVAFIWWNRAVQLREHGVLYGLRFLRWDHVTSCRWIVNAAVLEGLDNRHRDTRFQMNVPANVRIAAERIFAERLGQSPAFHDSLALSPAAAATPRFRIYSRGERQARGCLMMFLAYVSGVTLFGFAFHSQPREFQYGCLPGLAVAALYIFLQARRCRRAGSPRVRLRAGTDWRGVLALAAPAAAAYYVGYKWPFSLGWIASVVGFGVTAAFFLIIAREWSGHLDLCEEGVVAASWMYWPWPRIRVRQWNCDGNGRLVLSRGWQRAIAVVPPALRAEVDALLQDKLDGEHIDA